MTLGDPNICSGQYRSITTLKLRVAKWAGSEIVDSLPPELKFKKLLSLGIDWAMLIKSSSIQTTVVQTVIYTLVSQLVKIVQQFITTILTSKLAYNSPLSKSFVLL